MDCSRCLVLHKSQWDRLKKQAGELRSDKETSQFNAKRDYYKALDEKSKEWKNKWPDTVEGYLARVEARKERELERNKAFVKTFKEKARNLASDHTKAIAEAKLKIFHTSNYGQQLASAVRESKAIEERKAQIKLKKLIKQREIEYDKALSTQIANNMVFDMIKKDEEAVKSRKQKDKEQAEFNKIMHQYNEYQKSKEKEEEKLGELEDERLQKINLQYEKHEMDNFKQKAIEEIKQYEEDCRAIKEEKMKRDLEDNALIAVWAKYHDTVWCKEKKTWENIIKNRGESKNYKKAYEMAGKSLENDKKTYEAFIDKGIEEFEKSQIKAEEKINKKHLKSEEHRKQVIEDYKTALEVKAILKHRNKCCCDKQSLFTKPCEKNVKEVIGGDDNDTHRPESFLAPYTKLSDALERRRKQPTPWSAQSGAHEYFAEQAAAAIKECQYKHMAKKVVEDYKKSYYLDSTSLPIPEF